jgi:hypothetical protein
MDSFTDALAKIHQIGVSSGGDLPHLKAYCETLML